MDLKKVQEEINRLTTIPRPPENPTPYQLAIYHSQLAENYSKAISLLQEVQKQYPKADLSGTLNRLTQLKQFFEAYAKYNSALDVIYKNISTANSTNDINKRIQLYEDTIKALKDTFKYLSSLQFADERLKQDIINLTYNIADYMFKYERALYALKRLSIASELYSIAKRRVDDYIDPIQGMSTDQIIKIYENDMTIFKDAIEMLTTALNILQSIRDIVPADVFADLEKLTQKHIKAYQWAIDVTSSLHKFYTILASLPKMPQNATREQLLDYYNNAERVLSSALEAIKQYAQDEKSSLHTLYSYYQKMLNDVVEKKKKLLEQ